MNMHSRLPDSSSGQWSREFLSPKFFPEGNYSPVSEETSWAVCEGSVFGRDAKAKPTVSYKE
jgi:hypothetical protein